MGNASDSLDWLAPDPHGIRTAWLTDPNKSTLRGRRLRRAFDRPPAAIDTWPASWRELLAMWVKRANPEKRYKRDGLLGRQSDCARRAHGEPHPARVLDSAPFRPQRLRSSGPAMQLHLVLPGLVWPSASASGFAAGLRTPALESLLGHAHITRADTHGFESWLARLFGLSGDAPPLAALRRLGEDSAAPASGEWLCADPVHLHFARERLLLSDAGELGITADEAARLVADINDFLADEPGLGGFEAGAPTRWYLRLNAPAHARFVPLSDVVGRPVSHFLPEGEDARRWQRIGNDLQVFLHNHPINQALEAAGQRTINSLWLWGAGTLSVTPAAPAPCVLADDVLARGLARAAGVEPGAPALAPAGCDTLVVLGALHRPSLYLDVDTWRSRLLELEAQWFAPLAAALKMRRITTLRISAPGDRQCVALDIGAGDTWKFWRRPRHLETLTDPHR